MFGEANGNFRQAMNIAGYASTEYPARLIRTLKSDIIEHLWKMIISDNKVDQYESNLMRRICGLIYFPDKMSAEIKMKLLNKKWHIL